MAAELVKVGFLEEQIVLRPVLPARPKEEPGADEGVDPEADDGESGDEEEDPKLNPRRVRLVLMPKENFEASEQVTREAAEEEVQEAEGESSGSPGPTSPETTTSRPLPLPTRTMSRPSSIPADRFPERQAGWPVARPDDKLVMERSRCRHGGGVY